MFFGLVVSASAPAADNWTLRGSLQNSRIQFEREGKGHVAFLGGSITEMNGYRPMVSDDLRRRFPKTDFTFTNAGIASTCSTTGAFRLKRDVLNKGPVDLLFVEFAVNDDQDAGHARRECIRGMEGIVRQVRRHNPMADIVITYFVNPGMLAQLQAGKKPLPMAAHAAVAEHYQVSTIHLAQEVADRIAADKLTWKQFGGTHPAPAGNRICADLIDELLDRAWKGKLAEDAQQQPHPLPNLLDPGSYVRGQFIPPKTARADGWNLHVPPWEELPGGKRKRFLGKDLLCGTRPGQTLTLQFEGSAVGAYVLAGPDAGTVEVRVDEGEFRPVDLYHRFSKGLHYPRTVMFAVDLEPGKHTLELRISKQTASGGHAVRILQFVAN